MVTEEITFRRLGVDEDRADFDCGDADLNEFFANDSKEGCRQLVSVTYAVEMDSELVAFFCVSNDAIRSKDTSKSRFKKNTFWHSTSQEISKYACGENWTIGNEF